jgi:antitoxin FitA
MSQLTVRNVPDEIVRALRMRAAQHGRSAEAEHLLILCAALQNEADDFWMTADRQRRASRKQSSESGVLQRRMRDGC